MDPNLVFVLVAVLGFIAIAGVGFAFAGGDPAQVKAAKRVQAITTQSKAGEKRARLAPAEAATLRRKQILENLKAKGNDQFEQLGQTIGEKPMTSALVAFGVGFLVAKLLTRR